MLLIVALLIGLSWLLRQLMARVFTQVVSPPPVIPLPAARPAPPAVSHHYWLLPSGSDWLDVPSWVQQLFLGQTVPPSDIIDCRKLFAASSSPANEESSFANELTKLLETCDTLPISTGHFLIFTHFGHRNNEPAITNRKYRLLQNLLRVGRPLVLIASVHPVGFGDYNPADPPDRSRDPDHTSAWASGERLLNLLSGFRLQYFSLRWLSIDQPRYEAGVPYYNRAVRILAYAPTQRKLGPWSPAEADQVEAVLFGPPSDNSALRRYFDIECNAFPFVAAIRTEVLGALWRQRTFSTPIFHTHREYLIAKEKHDATQRHSQTNGNSLLNPDRKLRRLRQSASQLLKALAKTRKLATEQTKNATITEKDTYAHLGRSEPPTREAIADAIRRLAWLHFRRIWRTLSAQERFLLFDLAYDGLVNPKDRHHLHNLLHKGFLRLDEYGRPHVASNAFQAFLFADQRRPEALKYTEQSPDNLWASVQQPLVLLITVAALFVASTQPGPFLDPQRLLALAVAFVPQLSFLLKSSSPPRPAD